MVSKIDSARITGQTRSRAEPANGEAEQRGASRPASAESDVRLSLSETAKRLASDSIALGEAPRRAERPAPDSVDAPTAGRSAEIGGGPNDVLGDFQTSPGEQAAGPAAAYRTSARSAVGARISLRI